MSTAAPPIVIVGAGVLGLAVARALRHQQPLILEQAAWIGSETSSRNSQVLHAGLYYPPRSHKAQFCVRGQALLYDYARDYHLAVQRTGKLIVAATQDQVETTLKHLHRQGQANGVKGLEVWSSSEVAAVEPHVQCAGALYSPHTGLVDVHELMYSLLAQAEEAGATLALQTTVRGARWGSQGLIELLVDDDDDYWLPCRAVINAAGLWADHVARMIHATSSSNEWQPPRQYFAKGHYFRLPPQSSTPLLFQHLIYPVPQPGGLGIHATLDGSAGIKFGPNVEWLPPDAQPPFDYQVDATLQATFEAAIRTYYPDLPDHALAPDYTGVRPKLSHPAIHGNHPHSFDDFLIAGPALHGLPNVVHLLGMESPGLTSALAIAEHVASLLDLNKWMNDESKRHR